MLAEFSAAFNAVTRLEVDFEVRAPKIQQTIQRRFSDPKNVVAFPLHIYSLKFSRFCHLVKSKNSATVGVGFVYLRQPILVGSQHEMPHWP